VHKSPGRVGLEQEALPARGSGALIAKQVTASLSQLLTAAIAALDEIKSVQ